MQCQSKLCTGAPYFIIIVPLEFGVSGTQYCCLLGQQKFVYSLSCIVGLDGAAKCSWQELKCCLPADLAQPLINVEDSQSPSRALPPSRIRYPRLAYPMSLADWVSQSPSEFFSE